MKKVKKEELNKNKIEDDKSLLSSPHINKIIIDNLPIGLIILDKEGNIQNMNNIAELLTGYKKDELLGIPHFKIFHGSEDKNACPIFSDILRKENTSIAIEAELRRKNNVLMDVVVVGFPLFDVSGEFIGGAELFRDITEIKRLEKERKNLLSMFAHDMKNPIIATEGFLKRISSEKAGALTEKQKEYIAIIEGATKKLKRLITDFLDFSRLDRNEYRPVLSPYDMVEGIKKQLDLIKIEAEKKNIRIIFQYKKEESHIIDADALMIDRVVSNLIDNAVKYTNTGGTINIKVESNKENTVIEVADNGIGIHKEDLPHIFDAFFRVNKDGEGSGLGLSVARAIIEAHQGIISVDSQIGKGSRFWFSIPKNLSVLMHDKEKI